MRAKWIIGIVVGAAALVSGGTFVYFHFIQGDAPARLTLATASTATTNPSAATGTGSADVSGTWKAQTSGTQVGYRVAEVAFGQRHDAVGRTSSVTGSMTISGSTVSAVDLSVDMASITSSESRRDNQFRGRIMDTATYPTATFKLTQPIDLGSLPPAGTTVTKPATGQLTLRGTTKTVTFDLKSRRNGDKIEVNGTIPITFAEWSIPNPSFGSFVTTEDHGELELLLVFAR